MSVSRGFALLLLAFASQAPLAWSEGDAVYGFVEQDVQPANVVVGERVEIVVRVGLETSWREWLVPPLARSLDLPVRVQHGAHLEGAHPLPTQPLSPDRATFVLDGEVVHGERARVIREGRSFDVISVRRAWRMSQPGIVELPAPHMELRIGADWQESLLGTRVPGDIERRIVRGVPRSVEVREPPQEGRPATWIDAVGRFALGAALEVLPPPPDRALRLTLTVRGAGNLDALTLPGHGAFPGFHLLGSTDVLAGETRTIAYDLVAVDPQVTHVPVVELSSFDPERREYVVARSEALPLPRGQRAPKPPAGDEAVGSSQTVPAVLLVLALVAVAVALLLAVRARRARTVVHTPTAAWLALRQALDEQRPDVGARFTAWLADRLQLPPSALVGGGVEDRLREAGLAPPLANRLAAALDALVRARYGAPDRDAKVLNGQLSDLLDAVSTATSGET